MRDVVVRSSVKVGGMLMVSTGAVEVGEGGIIVIYGGIWSRRRGEGINILTDDLN